jgi:hypothetical protein
MSMKNRISPKRTERAVLGQKSDGNLRCRRSSGEFLIVDRSTGYPLAQVAGRFVNTNGECTRLFRRFRKRDKALRALARAYQRGRISEGKYDIVTWREYRRNIADEISPIGHGRNGV